MPRQCAVRRPKRRAARKRRAVREACRGRPREAADCSNGPPPDALGCSSRRSGRSDGLSERLHCLGTKIVLLGCASKCSSRWCAALGVRGAVNLGLQIGCHAVVPLESACGACADMVRRVHALRARCGCLRRLPWVGEYVSDSLLISSKHLGKNGLILSLVDRR